MFERERRMYGLFRQLQQDDLLTGDSEYSYSMDVSQSDVDYYMNTGGMVMQSLLRDQDWVFFAERGKGHAGHRLHIRAMRGRPVVELRDIKGVAVKA
ncbi:hypothetical protein F9643_003119 [Escherichia coli]|uniref:Uncharacterized protein n=1 Tax=Escherichia coli TaxID=562 RepID=A0A2A2CFN6_ECOLX|nr:hypothetical protein [Escherichia coli]EER0916676.1 hypothetical protein [Escherichia coli O168:H8]EES8553765.1 hypothetical protein [Escherichia coli O168]MVW44836.1 hypothetical protein [Enterobacteriaceae bacterium TzEc013]EER0947446.1 hypothetical protein [Escherichia coli O168:H8]EER2485443.1 hypothetical protein [Escherichia coli]